MLSCGDCFAAGTRVWTPRGAVAIEQLSPGTEVYSWDLEVQALVSVTVDSLKIKPADEVLEVTFADGLTLRVTTTHPFYEAKTRQYQKIGELKVGDEVLFFDLADRKKKILKIVRVNKIQGSFATYNLTVSGKNKNFFAEGVLVHNKRNCSGGDTGGEC